MVCSCVVGVFVAVTQLVDVKSGVSDSVWLERSLCSVAVIL